jgi:hypothetical protein
VSPLKIKISAGMDLIPALTVIGKVIRKYVMQQIGEAVEV